MQYTKLGNSDLTVSRICMGCMGFGEAGNGQHSWTIDEEHSREIIKEGLELGVNFFDTAVGYQSGTSEQYVGRALRDFAKRKDVVVCSPASGRNRFFHNAVRSRFCIHNIAIVNVNSDGIAADHRRSNRVRKRIHITLDSRRLIQFQCGFAVTLS